MTIRSTLLTGLFLALPVSAFADELKVEQLAELRTIVKDENTGLEQVVYTPADLVLPGETVRFTIKYDNGLPEAAEDIVLVVPIPEQMDFKSGSVQPTENTALLSFDGGSTFIAPKAELPNRVNIADATHIKWIFEEPILPGETGSVSAEAVLR